jgi:hypothetical protein
MIRLSNVEKAFSHGVTKTYVLRRIDLEIDVIAHPWDARSVVGRRILF